MYHIYYVTLVRIVFSVQFATIRGSREGTRMRGFGLGVRDPLVFNNSNYNIQYVKNATHCIIPSKNRSISSFEI